MPRIVVIGAAGTTQRRLLEEALQGLRSEGFSVEGKPEAGDWPGLFASLRTGGLFETRRLFVIEDAARLGPFPGELLPFVEGEEASSALVLVFDGDFRKNLGKALLDKVQVMRGEAVPLWGGRRVDWVREAACKEGIDLDRAAASLLAEWIDDPEEIRAQLPKLSLASRGRKVDTGVVEALCLDEGGRNLLRLLDGVCRGRDNDVLTALAGLRRGPSILPVVTALHNRLRLSLYQALLSPGEAKTILAALKARDYASRTAAEAARRYGPEPLKVAVAGLIALNGAEKRGLSKGWNGLTLLLLELLAASKRSSAR